MSSNAWRVQQTTRRRKRKQPFLGISSCEAFFRGRFVSALGKDTAKRSKMTTQERRHRCRAHLRIAPRKKQHQGFPRRPSPFCFFFFFAHGSCLLYPHRVRLWLQGAYYTISPWHGLRFLSRVVLSNPATNFRCVVRVYITSSSSRVRTSAL